MMLPINEMNQLFLATHPDIRRKLRAEYRKARPTVIVMSIKPKYAKAIYEGRKNWEFRKAPPPIYKEIYIYESAPVSRRPTSASRATSPASSLPSWRTMRGSTT